MSNSKVINDYLLKFSSFLFYLIPITLLTGPFLPDLIIVLVDIMFLIIIFNERNFYYFKNYFFYIFFVFNLFLIFSSINSEYMLFSLKSSLVYFRFTLFALATWMLIDRNKNLIKVFSLALFSSILIASIDGFYQYFNDINIFGFDTVFPNRLNLLFNDKAVLGGYLARLYPLAIALLIYSFEPSKKSYLIILFVLIMLDVLMFISGERTAIGLQFISTILLIIFLNNFRLIRFYSLVISFFVIMFIAFSNPEIKENNIDKTLNQLGLNSTSEKLNYFSPVHENYFLIAIDTFQQNKFIGSGPNTFRKTCLANNELKKCSTHPHNTYVQLLSETGLIGISFIFITLIYFIIIYLKQLILIFQKKEKYNDVMICLIITITLTLLPFLPTLNFFNNWINVIYYLPVGFLLSLVYDKNNSIKKL